MSAKRDPKHALQIARELMKSAKKIVVLTGAGISVPSGIPDFRSPGSGLWTHDDPMEVCSRSAFTHTPERFYNWLRPLIQTTIHAEPNPAHKALAALEKSGKLLGILTQNIDGLHQRAGSNNVIELHGGMEMLVCLVCQKIVPMRDYINTFLEQNLLPRCPHCHEILKPNIVLFEEFLPADAWSKAEEMCSSADLMLVAGSSLTVSPVNNLPLVAIRHGSKLLINNYSLTYLDSQADVVLRGDIADVLPLLLKYSTE